MTALIIICQIPAGSQASVNPGWWYRLFTMLVNGEGNAVSRFTQRI